jgi:flagellar basal-body rod protein FlgG
MDNGVRISAAAMMARDTQNEFIAQNAANLTTDYYKAKEVFFVNNEGSDPEALTSVDVDAGAMKETKDNLDIVLGGKYFLKTVDDSGNTFYIKDGRLGVNSEGELSYQGYKVLDTQGETIKVANQEDITITKSGEVVQNGVATNTLAVVEADKNARISPGVNNMYVIDSKGVKTPEGYNFITQGYREASNVNMANEMIKTISMTHAYESSQKAILANDEAVSRAISDLGKF